MRSGLPDFARYRPLLADPGFRNQALAGFFAQLSQGGTVLALILLIQQARGSLGLAGFATAGFVVGAAIARPIQGRLIDTHGPRNVLLLTAAAHTAALVALVPVARSDLLGLAVVVMALVAGLGLPPVSQTQRLVWADVAGEDRTTVYSVIGMFQEGSILGGAAAGRCVGGSRLALCRTDRRRDDLRRGSGLAWALGTGRQWGVARGSRWQPTPGAWRAPGAVARTALRNRPRRDRDRCAGAGDVRGPPFRRRLPARRDLGRRDRRRSGLRGATVALEPAHPASRAARTERGRLCGARSRWRVSSSPARSCSCWERFSARS